jgi:hypothetical protein
MADPAPKTVSPQDAAAARPASPADGLFKPLLQLFSGGAAQLDVHFINMVLLGVICLLVVYGGISAFISFKGLRAIAVKQYSAAAMAQTVQEFKGVAPLPPASFYQKKIAQRNIFKRGAKPGDDKMTEAGPSSKTAEMLKNLRLVGISWSDNPDIMIEDVKLAKTFFVKKGQMVGEFKVENVFKDKVILRYNKETVELK